MELQKQIQEIHDSNLFGVIVETGAGACIANTLYNVPGASKTIYFSEQPYNKIYQRSQKYLPDNARSISITFIHHTIKTLKTKYQFAWPGQNINFVLVSTFQLGDSTNSKLTHGYIGLYNFAKDDIRVIHLSIPENLTRPQYLEIITEAGITLLHNSIQENSNPKDISYVDKILSVNVEDGSARDLKIPLLENLIGQDKETFLVFQNDSWNSVIRYEDFLRDKIGVILQKGSFNPLHHGHRTIFDKTAEQYPGFAKAFLISINNRDKASIRPEEVLNRISEIFKLGYEHVIVCKDLLLLDTADYHIKHWADKTLVMPMGQDTLIRFVDDLIRTKTLEQTLDAFSNKYVNVAFEVFDRKMGIKIQEHFKDLVQLFCNFREDYIDDGISSTQLRAKQAEDQETEKLWKEFLKIS